MKLNDFVINSGCSFKDALKKIDLNKKGFLIVEDAYGEVVGTLTDGDIRRCVLKGFNVADSIKHGYNREFTFLEDSRGFYEIIELFKNKSIKFVPVLNRSKHLINIITKAAMHVLLLKGEYPDFTFDFLNVDEGLVDYEIAQRPWGFFKTTIMNNLFQSKIISVDTGASISLQVHHQREEHWIIVNGEGIAQIGDSLIEAKGGSHIFIPKGCKHRLTNISETMALILIEIQRGQYFGEDDIIRYEDKYGRAWNV